jgi:lipid II:glycine glycyltransferase (peptidoglycan interpeptide bridge formation enzyme)
MTHDRRKADLDNTDEIEMMIAEETDPRIRVQLLMMHKLTSVVSTMSESLSDLDEKFTAHSADETAVVNQVKGAWKVAAWVFGIAQVVVVFLYTDMNTQVKELHAAYHKDILDHERIIGRVNGLADKIKDR